MLYPVYVHVGDETHAHGVTFPDFPGCFSAADNWEELTAKIQEAVECYFDGEDKAVPPPSPMDKLMKDAEYQGGTWMLVDIDLTKINTKCIRINVSLPENLVGQIDRFAESHHMSRSGFLALAAQQALTRA